MLIIKSEHLISVQSWTYLILWVSGGGGGGGGGSIRHGAFVRGERLTQTLHRKRDAYYKCGVYFRVGDLLIIQ